DRRRLARRRAAGVRGARRHRGPAGRAVRQGDEPRRRPGRGHDERRGPRRPRGDEAHRHAHAPAAHRGRGDSPGRRRRPRALRRHGRAGSVDRRAVHGRARAGRRRAGEVRGRHRARAAGARRLVPRLRSGLLMTDSPPRRHLPPERVVTWLAMAGFMGTGKSRIGWELSRRLQLTFVDTDRVIERVSCMRITDIFELYGEEVFRHYETEVVKRCVRLDEVVVSTGGGTVVRPENRALLKARGPVVVLTASPETVYRRTRRHRRPMLEV